MESSLVLQECLLKMFPQGWLEASAWQVYVTYQDPGRNPALSIQLKWVNEQKWQSRWFHMRVNLQHL